MTKLLVPIAGNANDRFAVQEVVKRFMNDTRIELHLLNVQAPFSADVAHFSSPRSRHGLHRERAEKALAPAREMLDRFSIPYTVHTAEGDRATAITAFARQLPAVQIVMATARKNALTRLVENSVTDKVIECSPVPVEVVPGEAMSTWERFGIPAALALGLVAVLAMLD